MKKEKIMVFLMGIGCLVTTIILCFSLGIFERNKNRDIFYKITPNEVVNALEEKREMIIYCGQDTCSACRAFSPILQKISVEDNKKIYYLDVDLISSQKRLEKYQIQETPTLINITNGEIFIYRGTMNEEDIRKAISQNAIERIELEGITGISYDSLVQIESQAKDFILYIGREDCGDCKKFKPILEQYLLDNSNGVYYLSLKEYREKANKENASKEDIKRYEDLKAKYGIDWVPTVIHIRNGIQVARYEFLDEEYGKLEENRKEEYEQQYVTQFYEWMNRELKY